jgi:hypothetical protein
MVVLIVLSQFEMNGNGPAKMIPDRFLIAEALIWALVKSKYRYSAAGR